jgi:glycosyltransferase involved in cell wall biosynthesis
MELWWAGGTGWKLPKGILSPTKGQRLVRPLGAVDDARLCELYRTATATIYPSLYEGFGLPVLDSLRHGAAVLCSANSSLLEFEGDGVYFLDPRNPETFDLAWEQFQSCERAPFRPDLERRCTWANFAQELLELC